MTRPDVFSALTTRVWATRAEARRAVFAYISYYNRHRLHSTLKLRTPHEARVCYRPPTALTA
jgi:transposase InsO family protein